MTALELTAGERLYRIGVNTDCPLHQVFAGGQCFPRRSQKVTGYGAATQRNDMRGAIVRMQAGQLEKCIESAKHKVIRQTKGRKSRARVYDTRSPKYRKMQNDEPVINYMWFEELDSLHNPFEPTAKPTIADHIKASEPKPEPKPEPSNDLPSSFSGEGTKRSKRRSK